MKTGLAAIAIAVSAASSGCDAGRDAQLEARISKLKDSEAALESKLQSKDAEIKEIRTQHRQAVLELQKMKSAIVKEVRDRLAAIESDYSEAIVFDAEVEKGLKTLDDAEAKFAAEVKKAAEKNKKFMEMIQTTDPIWAFTSGEDWATGLADALAELQSRNRALESELEALKAGRAHANPAAEQGADDQPPARSETKGK